MYSLAIFFLPFKIAAHPAPIPLLYFVGRLFSAAFGVLSVALVYAWGRRLTGQMAGFIGALALALASTHIEQSHYATVDVALGFWVAFSLFLLTQALQAKRLPRSRRLLYGAAIAAGLAAGTKYNGGLLLAPLAAVFLDRRFVTPVVARRREQVAAILSFLLGVVTLASAIGLLSKRETALAFVTGLTSDGHLEQEYVVLYRQLGVVTIAIGVALIAISVLMWCRLWPWLIQILLSRDLWLVLGFFVLTFIIVSPYFFLDYRAAIKDFFYEVRHMRIGAAAQQPEDDPLHLAYVRNLPTSVEMAYRYGEHLVKEFGLLSCLLVVLGIWCIWRRDHQMAILLTAYLVPQLYIIISARNLAYRYLMPLYPHIALLLGAGMVGLNRLIVQRAQHIRSQLLKRILLLSLVLLTVLPIVRTVMVVFLTRYARGRFHMGSTASTFWGESNARLPVSGSPNVATGKSRTGTRWVCPPGVVLGCTA
jgi:4-amino-4-deoxy-L-arabinose transferase-like glycosyltransferase